MENKLKKQRTLQLGKELSRNELKKVMGGCARVTCSDGSYTLGGNCATQSGYCAAAHHGSFVGCSSC